MPSFLPIHGYDFAFADFAFAKAPHCYFLPLFPQCDDRLDVVRLDSCGIYAIFKSL
jgi:hypothetical protein